MISRTAYDLLYEALGEYPERPYAIMMGRRDWNELRADSRARKAIESVPGDPFTFCRVPVRIEGRRMAKQEFRPHIFATAQELHDALYEGNEKRKRRRF